MAGLLLDLAEYRDKSTFVRVYEHFAPRVKAYMIRLGANEESAEDLSQEAMLKVWRKCESAKGVIYQ